MSDISAEVAGLFARAKKAVVGAVTTAVGGYTAAVSAALLAGADLKTALAGSAVAAVVGAVGGFGFVYAAPANKPQAPGRRAA